MTIYEFLDVAVFNLEVAKKAFIACYKSLKLTFEEWDNLAIVKSGNGYNHKQSRLNYQLRQPQSIQEVEQPETKLNSESESDQVKKKK